jgi:predicted benzoate:H+ symporter BenE
MLLREDGQITLLPVCLCSEGVLMDVEKLTRQMPVAVIKFLTAGLFLRVGLSRFEEYSLLA